MDEQNCEKGCNVAVSASPSSSGKRTNSSHKKDKVILNQLFKFI